MPLSLGNFYPKPCSQHFQIICYAIWCLQYLLCQVQHWHDTILTSIAILVWWTHMHSQAAFRCIWLFKYVATKWKSVLTLHFPTRYFADFIIDNFNTVLCRFLLYLRNFRSILVLILWKKGRSKKHSPSKGILKLKPCWTDMTCSLKNTITSSSTVFQLQDMSCHSFWWWKTFSLSI